MVESDKKKPWEHAGALIGVVSALIAAVVAVTQQRPASVIAVAIAVVLLGGWFVIWTMRAKIANGWPRFPRGRWIALAAGSLVLVGSGILMTIPSPRTVIGHNIFGFSSVKEDVGIAEVLVAESDTAYRITIVAWNQTPSEALATAVKLETNCPPPHPATRPDVYQIQQQLAGGAVPGDPHVNGNVVSSAEPTFRVQVDGQIVKDYCGPQVDLSFDISQPLPVNEHTSIFVDLPKSLTVVDDRPVPQILGSTEKPHPATMNMSVARPSRKNFIATLVVSGVDLSASPID